MTYKTFDVVRVGGGEILRTNLHPAAAETLAYHYNRTLYRRGPFCEVRPSTQSHDAAHKAAQALVDELN